MIALLLVACGTLHGEGAGDRNLPSAGMGPFRVLEEGEVDQAPYLSVTRTAAGRGQVVRLADGTFALYRGEERDGVRSIVRETSPDGLAFADTVEVLSEGTAPAVVLESDRVRLWYESAGRILYTESGDGTSFAPGSEAFSAAVDWEGGFVGAPSVVPDDGGGYLLYYAARGGIGVATSVDGTHFVRVGDSPIIPPGEPGEWDDRAVGRPAARAHVSPTGRRTVQLFYVGIAAAAASDDPPYAVGVAASFDGRVFERSPGGPVLERSRPLVGLGPPVSIGPADLIVFLEEVSSGVRVAGAVSPAEVRFGPVE
jgi:hypothetical protein